MIVKMEAYNDGEHWCARGVGEDVFTQGQTLDELMANIQEAVALHFEGRTKPRERLNLLVLIECEAKVARKAAAG